MLWLLLEVVYGTPACLEFNGLHQFALYIESTVKLL